MPGPDVIAFRVEPAVFSGGHSHQLVPVINGRSLLDLEVPVHRTKAGPRRSASGTVRLGEGQAGLAMSPGHPADLRELHPPAEASEAAVLGCACGVTYCAPVLATISRDRDAVIWELHGHTFRFDRRQYQEALKAVAG